MSVRGTATDAVAVLAGGLVTQNSSAPVSLAPLLYRQSDLLAELGREQEALAAIEEAVHIYRELAAASPAPFSADLADSLDNCADLLSTLERHSDAAAARAQATQLRGHL
jgi:tetratricopeptide (TPR) repeat protein